jgi:hypothetical protein
MLASAKWPAANYAAGRVLAIKAKRLTQLSANFHEEANSLWIEAGFCRKFGDYTHSLLLLQEARERLRLCGMSGGNLDRGIMGAEAETYMLKSEYTEARSIHVATAQSTSPEQDMFRHANALLCIAQIDIAIGVTGFDVEHNLTTAKIIMSSIGYPTGVKECEMHLASLRLAEGDLLMAKNMFHKCLEWSWGKNAEVSSFCLEEMADTTRWGTTNFDWASTFTVVYLSFAQKSQQKHAVHKAFLYLGDVFHSNGDEGTAENLFIVALEGFTQMDVHCSRADCMLRLGDVMKKRQDMARAESLWREARTLFKQSLQDNGVAEVDIRLCDLVQD